MFLTREEEAILNGEKGDGQRKAIELLVALGDIKGADGFVDIKSAHVSGVSYLTIGDPGLELLNEWASTGVKARVPATTNPVGLDLESWEELGFPEKFAKKQEEILRAYETMDIRTTCSCTPYLTENVPAMGDHLAWAESNAVAYSNSVLGAKTNRESGISALAASILGKVPNYGLHLDENRRATFEVKVEAEMDDPFYYSAMGYHIGRVGDGIPLFTGINPGVVELKALGAALATGGVSMFHIEDKTPGSDKISNDLEKMSLGRVELDEARERLNTSDGDVDLVCIGCPHCSVDEVIKVSKLKPQCETWVFTSRYNKQRLQDVKLHENIKVIYDTCMVVSPLKEIGFNRIGVNSAKAAYYSPSLSKVDVKFSPLKELIDG